MKYNPASPMLPATPRRRNDEPHYPLAENWTAGRREGTIKAMLIYIQCTSCRCEVPATLNEGVPDIPAHWRGMWAECSPGFEVYACSQRCAQRAGFMLSESNPGSSIMERRVEVQPTL